MIFFGQMNDTFWQVIFYNFFFDLHNNRLCYKDVELYQSNSRWLIINDYHKHLTFNHPKLNELIDKNLSKIYQYTVLTKMLIYMYELTITKSD